MQVEALLAAAARGQFAPAYLLAGSELFFRDKAREALVKFFLDGRPEGLAEHDLAEIPLRDALDDAATLGLFEPRRVVWLRNADALVARRADPGPTLLSAYLERPNPQAVVVFEARLDDREKIDRLEKMLPGCQRVDLERAPAAQAARYLAEEATRAGFVLEPVAARELVEATGGDLARASVELEKLMAYAGLRRAISARDVREVVPSEPVYIIWELGDSIGRRDGPGALERLAALLRGGHKPLPILGLIAGHVRKLLRAKSGTAQWLPREVQRQAQKFSLPELRQAQERIFQSDLELRSSPPDERLVLEKLVLDLAGKEGGGR